VIGKLRGRILEKRDNKVLLDVSGVGYELLLPSAVAKSIEGKGKGEVVEFVTLCFFQIEQSRVVPFLIGFEDEVQREFFECLLLVPRLGPRAALNLYCVPMTTIASAIEQGNVNYLASLPGVGKRRARDIIATLQGRMAKFFMKGEHKGEAVMERDVKAILDEALEVMMQLGYKRKEAQQMLKKALEHRPDVSNAEELIRVVYELKGQ